MTLNSVPQMHDHSNNLFKSSYNLSPSSWPRTKWKHLESSANWVAVMQLLKLHQACHLYRSRRTRVLLNRSLGTPDITGRKPDAKLSITTVCLLPDELDLNQANREPLIPLLPLRNTRGYNTKDLNKNLPF